MIKRCLIGFTVLISCFLFTSKISAATITGRGGHIYTNVSSEKVVIYNSSATNNYDTITSFRYAVIPSTVKYLYKHSAQWWIQGTSTFGDNKTALSFSRYKASSLSSWSSMSSATYFSGGGGTHTFEEYVDYSYYDIWSNDFSEILYCGDVETECSTKTSDEIVIDETNKTITIPIYHFYKDGEWQNYYLYFAAPTINNMNYSLKFEYLSKDTNLPELPIELIIHDKIDDVHQHLANISNSKYTAGNGFGGGFSVNAGNFGGGGGGGRLDDDTDTNSCMATTPFTYSGSFANERIYGLAALSLNSCYDLTGKTPDDFNTEAIKITYSARIVDLNTEGELGSDEIGDMLEDIRNEHQLEQDSISFEIFAPVIKLVTDKLPIINQFNQILNQFNYNETFDTPPTFVVDIPYFNLKNIEVFNFQFFDDYRDYVLSLQCIVLAIFTGVKCYRIVSGYFGGGENE